MEPYRQLFRLNVGFVAHEQVGYSREFVFESIPRVWLDDLELRGVEGQVRVTRTPQGLLFQVMLSATTPAECVRCLSPFDQPLRVLFTELYAFSVRGMTESGLLYPETGIVDLGPLVREYMLLELPIKPLCRPDCRGLCPVCGANQNEGLCRHEPTDIDPRLAVLRSLLDS